MIHLETADVRATGARETAGLTDILCISSIDWDFIWQGHQEIMSSLAADGRRVLFLENTGVRPLRFRDLPRLRRRLRNWSKGPGGFREERPNLFVLSPIVLPGPYSRIATRINRFLLLRSIRRWMRTLGVSRPIAWTFLPTPLAHELITFLDPALTIYYCIDDLASSSPEARRIASSEEAMFRRADLVFVTSEKLRQRAATFTPRVHLFPFGVKYEAFEAVRESPRRTPADMAGLTRPIVGYVGGLHQWIDQDLVAETAAKCRDTTFVFVGPPQCDLSRLEATPNVKLLGGKPHSELPHYVREFDVGLVPYKLSEYTANVYPTKLNEYLAMGIPVVASDLAEIRRFNAEHGEIVAIARDSGDFAAAINRSISGASPDAVGRRLAVAQANSWPARIGQMSNLIAGAMATRARQEERWDARLRRVYQRARRRTVEVVLAVVFTYLLLFQTPLVWLLARPLRIVETPQQADCIVVFAGGVGESGKAGGGYQERVKQATELYHQGYARHLVFSSGFVFAFPEAEIMRALAVDNGVPASAIELETRAANTRENVLFSQRILNANGLEARPARELAVPHAPRHADLAQGRAGCCSRRDARANQSVLRARSWREPRTDARHLSGVRRDRHVLVAWLDLTLESTGGCRPTIRVNRFSYVGPTRRRSKSAARARPRRDSSRRRSGSSISASTAAANAAASPTGVSTPYSLSPRISTGPNWHAVETMGTPSAIDSISAFGRPSKREVRTEIVARARYRYGLRVKPVKITSEPRPSSALFARTRASSSPSPTSTSVAERWLRIVANAVNRVS